MRAASACFCALLLAFPHIARPQDSRSRVAVLDLTAENIPSSDARILADRMRAELVNTGRFIVLERAQMESILKEQGFVASGCVATECAVEIGQLLGVEKMIAGAVERFGEMYTVTARMIDVKTGVLEQTSIEDCRCPIEDLLAVTSVVVRKLGGLGGALPSPSPPSGEIGIIYVASTPAGARITLDGVPREEVTPTTLENIPVGEHVIRLAKESLVAEERVTVLRDDLLKLSFELRPGVGSLFVNSVPPEARVTIDEKYAGVTPVLIREVDVGTHLIRVEKNGYLPWSQRQAAQFGERVNIPVTLQQCGYLVVAMDPADAHFSIDERRVELEKNGSLALAPGVHSVVAMHTDYDSAEYRAEIAAGMETRIEGVLSYRFGRISVTSDPPGASVRSVPSVLSGTTPVTFAKVMPGRYEVWISMEEHVPHRATFEVHRNSLEMVHADLELTPEANRDRRRESMRIRTRMAAITLAIAAGFTGVVYNNKAHGDFDQAKEYHGKYAISTTELEASQWRRETEEMLRKGNRKISVRNICYGLLGSGLGVGIAMSIDW